MLELQVQSFLRNRGTLDDLASGFLIKSRRHETHPNLISLKYDQKSPFASQIVRECRGLVLDESDDWKIISRGFDKFFNHGEGHAAEIDWKTARVQEKLDGSLCVVYFYRGLWNVATTGTPDGSGNVGLSIPKITFAQLFHKVYESVTGEKFDGNRDVAYAFELCTSSNKIVIRHEVERVVLLSARSMITQEEIHPSIAVLGLHKGIEFVREFDMSSVKSIIDSFDQISPMSQEGYVVVDALRNRIKIKHPGYIALHHMQGGLNSVKSMVEIVRSGEIDEVLVAFPEHRERLEIVSADYSKLVGDIESDYAVNKHIENQKEFALAVRGSRCASALFQVRSGRFGSVYEYLRDTNVNSLMLMLGYKETKQEEISEE